jgi:hypothetical protein
MVLRMPSHDTMLHKMLTNTGTYAVPDSSASPSWSRESIIALATIFVMVFLSFLGFMLKHRLRKLMLSRLGQRWPYMVAQGIHAKHWRRSRRLTTLRHRASAYVARRDKFELG